MAAKGHFYNSKLVINQFNSFQLNQIPSTPPKNEQKIEIKSKIPAPKIVGI